MKPQTIPVADESEPSGNAGTVGELVGRAIQGDGEAFRALVESHEAAVFGLCRRLLGNATEAEDVTQETFVRAYRFLPRLEDRERFAPWLHQIARSLCRERIRSFLVERRVLSARLELERRQAVDAGDDEGDSGTATALAELPPEERQALTLRYFEGLSYEAIGGRLGLSFSQVDHLIRKARARLARRIEARKHVEAR